MILKSIRRLESLVALVVAVCLIESVGTWKMGKAKASKAVECAEECANASTRCQKRKSDRSCKR